MVKKSLKMLITATLAFSLVLPTAVFAYEPEEEFENDCVEEIDAELYKKKILEEDVVAKEADQDAVHVIAKDKNETEVTTQNVSAEDGNGILVVADNSGKADVTVNGNATGAGSMLDPDEDVQIGYSGAAIVASDNGEANLTITGNATGSIQGAGVAAGNGVKASITVGGDAVSTSYNADEGSGLLLGIVDEPGNNKSTVNATVGGNVKGSNGLTICNGLNENATHDLFGTANSFDGGDVNVTVNGDAIGSGSEYSRAIEAYAFNGAVSNIYVGGDAKGEQFGVIAGAKGDGATNNIVVAGTVSGKEAGIASKSKDGSNSITVWKIETGKNAPLVATYDADNNLVEDKEAEKKVQYIIKVDQPKGATLKATDANGKALATVTAVNGKTFEYAHSGDKVLLKIDVDDDYKLDAVYGDKGQQYKLVKDASGNYYVEVPAGGGVYFSAVLTKKDKDKDDEEEKKETKTNTTVPIVSTEAQNAITSIVSTPIGGTSNIAITGTSIDASVVRMLLARRDINVNIACFVNGKLCLITIPAGANISDLIAANGTIDVAKLAERFGKVEVK